MKNLFSLTGKTALVTGCKRGIGKAMAIGLAKAGAQIIGVSTTLEPQGSDAEKAVLEAGQSFKAFRCDFTDRAALHSLIREVKAECSSIDILVNNAGTIMRKPAAEHPDDYWDKVIEVNLNAQFSRRDHRSRLRRQQLRQRPYPNRGWWLDGPVNG